MKSIVLGLLVVLIGGVPVLAGDCYGRAGQAIVVPQHYGQVLMFSQPVQQAYYLSSRQRLAIVDRRYEVVNRPQRIILRNVQKQSRARNFVIQRRGLFGLRSRIIVD